MNTWLAFSRMHNGDDLTFLAEFDRRIDRRDRMIVNLVEHGRSPDEKIRPSYAIGRQHVATLMKRIGIEAIYRRPNTSKPAPGHKIYPYLLRKLEVSRPNQVWAMDITYIPMVRGFVYLAAVIDWFSRKVLSHRVSIAMETGFCIEALQATTGGRLDCAEIVIQTLATNEPRVILPCNGDRVFGMAQDNEMTLAFPRAYAQEIIEGLEGTHKGAIR